MEGACGRLGGGHAMQSTARSHLPVGKRACVAVQLVTSSFDVICLLATGPPDGGLHHLGHRPRGVPGRRAAGGAAVARARLCRRARAAAAAAGIQPPQWRSLVPGQSFERVSRTLSGQGAQNITAPLVPGSSSGARRSMDDSFGGLLALTANETAAGSASSLRGCACFDLDDTAGLKLD